jgi:hypothetical protein
MVKGEGGKQFEKQCRSVLEIWCPRNGLVLSEQSKLQFPKPGGGSHFVDIEIISSADKQTRGLFSCKWQKSGGTTDEKIAYEVIKLLSAMEFDPRYKHAWIAMGGTGWSPSILKFITTNEIEKWIPAMKGKITIFTDPNDLMQRAQDEIQLNS